ncbi:hypothetical protein ACO0OE_003995 [Hanseniaspora uvarum]
MSTGCKIETKIEPYPIDLSNQELLTHFQTIQDYYEEISENIYNKNCKNQPDINLILQQPELQPINLTRNNIVNFIYHISLLTRCFNPIVFHATCRTYDRYSSKRVILKQQQKLVAATCLWMVAKSYGGCNHIINNEVVATNGRFRGPVMRARIPRLKELVQIIQQFNKQESMKRNSPIENSDDMLCVDEQMLKQMEKHILDTLQWEIIEPLLSEYIMNVDEFCITQYEQFLSNNNENESDQDLKIFLKPNANGDIPAKITTQNDYFSKICNVINPVCADAINTNDDSVLPESDLFYKIAIMKIKFFILDIVQFDLEFVKFKYNELASGCLMFLELCLPGSIDEKRSFSTEYGLSANKLSILNMKINNLENSLLNSKSNIQETNYDNIRDNLKVLQNEIYAMIQSNFNGTFLTALIKCPEGNKRSSLYIRDKIWSNLIMNITGNNEDDEYKSVYMKNCILHHCNENTRSKLVINSFIKRAIDLFNCKVELQNMMDHVLSLLEACSDLAKDQYVLLQQNQLKLDTSAAMYLNYPSSTFISSSNLDSNSNSLITGDDCLTAVSAENHKWSTPCLATKRRLSVSGNDSDTLVTPTTINQSVMMDDNTNSSTPTKNIKMVFENASVSGKTLNNITKNGFINNSQLNVGPGSYITPPASRNCSTTGTPSMGYCKDGKFVNQTKPNKQARQFTHRLASIDFST